jgi:single-stranded-DNA-specific exonuclease
MPEHMKIIKSGKPFDLIFQLQLNEWQGNQSVQMQVMDIKPTEINN